MTLDLKYRLYEHSTQTPDTHIANLLKAYRENFKTDPCYLREDFSGAFLVSAEWIKGGRNRQALALDIDSEPLAMGKKFHYAKLSPNQKKRLKVKKQNVMKLTTEKIDVAAAFNFSFYALKKRKDLLQYFRSAYKSLKPRGMLSLEMVGGPDFITEKKEKTTYWKNGKPWFTYYWDQISFDPLTRNGHYAIHFKLRDGREIKNAFTYDWRVWTIPEVKDILEEAGFSSVQVYWDAEKEDQNGADLYSRVEVGENDPAWIVYVNAFKGL